MLRKLLFLLVFAPALITVPAWAQGAEFTLFGGIRLGGDFNYTFPTPGGGFTGAGVDVANTANYGVILNIPVNDYAQVEVLYDHQGSELTVKDPPERLQNASIDVGINYYQIGGMYHRPETMVQPFTSVTLGVAHFDPAGDFDSRWRFAAGLAAGARVFFSERVGLRLQSRLMGTVINDADVFCDAFGCFAAGGTYMAQIDFSGGLIIAF